MALTAPLYGTVGVPRPLALAAVRRWLHGSWALLFSHPDDFACYDFETDRWLLHVREAFTAASVRPLALSSTSAHHVGWIPEVGGCAVRVGGEETQRIPVLRDANENVLNAAVREATTRFVMTLDDSLRLRRTYSYTPADRLPSPMQLAALAGSLRLSVMRTAPAHRGPDLVSAIPSVRRSAATASLS